MLLYKCNKDKEIRKEVIKMKKVEFIENGEVSYEEGTYKNVDVYVNDELFGELTHENSFEWNLVQFVNSQRDVVNDTVSYYDDLEETKKEIQYELENY